MGPATTSPYFLSTAVVVDAGEVGVKDDAHAIVTAVTVFILLSPWFYRQIEGFILQLPD